MNDDQLAVARSAFLALNQARQAMNRRAENLISHYGPNPHSAYFSEIADQLEDREKDEAEQMMELVSHRDIWQKYLKFVKGIGKKTAARLVGGPIDPEKAHYPSSFYKYCGLAVVDGEADKMKRGEQAGYNPEYKSTLLGIVAENFSRARGFYKNMYDTKYKPAEKQKAKEAEDDWSDGYIHKRARRKMIKLFVGHWWEVWRKLEGLRVSEPYVVKEKGHKYYPPVVEIDGAVVEWEKGRNYE